MQIIMMKSKVGKTDDYKCKCCGVKIIVNAWSFWLTKDLPINPFPLCKQCARDVIGDDVDNKKLKHKIYDIDLTIPQLLVRNLKIRAEANREKK